MRWVIVAVWFAAIFAAFSFNIPGKFADAENNESVSYLPDDAQSTRALEQVEKLTDGEQVGIVIVYSREGGLTGADRKQIRSDVAELNGEIEGTSEPFALAQVSDDGAAALVLSSIEATGEAETILDPVNESGTG